MKKTNSTTDLVFFDCDCLSSFLWVEEHSVLPTLYRSGLVIPEQVYVELSHPSVPHLKEHVDRLLPRKFAQRMDIDTDSPAYDLYISLICPRGTYPKVIGKGEASAIALTHEYDGVLASNNLKDISHFVEEFKLQHITTGDILVEALRKDYISKEVGNKIWEAMLKRRSKLGAESFSAYLHHYGCK